MLLQLELVIAENDISPSNLYNMDEKGTMLGMSGKQKVYLLKSRDYKKARAGGVKQGQCPSRLRASNTGSVLIQRSFFIKPWSYLFTGGNRENVTTIETVSADGFVLPPIVIMKGKSTQRQWIEDSPLPNETLWCSSENGWTDNELGIAYIKHFDEYTKERW